MNGKAIKGVNDLATTNPEVLRFWDYEKNGDITPEIITRNYKHKLWWKCPECGGNSCCGMFQSSCKKFIGSAVVVTGHCFSCLLKRPPKERQEEYNKYWALYKSEDEEQQAHERYRAAVAKAKAENRYHNGAFSYTNFQDANPTAAAEWHPTKNGDLKPFNFAPSAKDVVWWLGKCGHEWQASVANRCRGQGCQICESSDSRLENITKQILEKYKYDFKSQVKFEGLVGTGGNLLSYDFGVYENGELDFLIECQGGQHYEPVEYFGGMEKYKIQLEHDRLKRDFCQGNHILLIEIPYTYSDEEIEAIFSR